MFPPDKSKIAGAAVLLALLAAAWTVRVHHPQLLWIVVSVGLGWCALELRTRSLVQHREQLASLVAERTAELREEKLALTRVQKELALQATHDSLTGVWNRAAILRHMEREMIRAQREVTVLAVVIADLDRFRQINDSQGHLFGDRVLSTAAERLAFCLREYDSLGRYGGEEFLILIPGYDPAEGRSRLDELVGSIRDHTFIDDGREIHASCSFGVTVFRPATRLASVEELLATADAALYRAKAAGRNCAIFLELSEMQGYMGRA
jgi:diguanylate cyclase (GGDEF)-like protein